MVRGDISKRKPTRTFDGETYQISGTQSGRLDVEQKTVKRLRERGSKQE